MKKVNSMFLKIASFSAIGVLTVVPTFAQGGINIKLPDLSRHNDRISINFNNNRNDDRYAEESDALRNVSMDKNGNVAVRSATVTAISSNSIVANIQLGASVLTWTGTISGNTKLEGKNGKPINFADISVGDRVTLKGTMLSGSGLNLNLNLIRDLQKKATSTPVVNTNKQIFEGKLVTQPGSSVPTTLTMQIGNTLQVVSISPSTMILNSAWVGTGLTNFMAGDTVRVFGYYSNGTSTVTGLVLRNASR